MIINTFKWPQVFYTKTTKKKRNIHNEAETQKCINLKMTTLEGRTEFTDGQIECSIYQIIHMLKFKKKI